MIFTVGLVSCSENSLDQNDNQLNGIEKEFVEQVEFLTSKNSMVITPNYHSIDQQIAFSPQGIEINLLSSLGFEFDQSSLFSKGDWKCGFGKYGAAREVGRITDNGGCALVKKGDDDDYCVKEVACE